MKVKNVSKGNFNLASGILKPGEIGEVNLDEYRLLSSSSKIEMVQEKPAVKKIATKKINSNG